MVSWICWIWCSEDRLEMSQIWDPSISVWDFGLGDWIRSSHELQIEKRKQPRTESRGPLPQRLSKGGRFHSETTEEEKDDNI